MVDLPRPPAPRRPERDISHPAAPAWQGNVEWRPDVGRPLRPPRPARGGARRLRLAGAAVDVPGLADRIRAACADPALAQAAGRAGRRFAAGFDWDVLADRQDEVYRSVLEVAL